MKESGPLWLTSEEALKLVTEREWQGVVVAMLHAHGWKTFSDRQAFRSDPGFPDVYAVNTKQRRAMHVEFKKMGGKASKAQIEWLDALRAAGVEAYLLRPNEWGDAVRIAVERCDGLAP